MKHIANRFLALLLTVAMVLPMLVFPMPVNAVETVTPDPVTGVMSWDFSDESQLSDFTLYQSGTSCYTLQDGVLRPTGDDGEMKAMINADLQDITYLSVDIIPGNTVVNSGVYVGASNAGNTAGQIDALAILVESMCSGWPDAPNRIDIVTGSFAPWKETGRVLSETGNGNALYKNGEKKPVNLRLDFGSDNIMITLSLVEDPSKNTQTVYYCDPQQMQGQIGLRSQFSDVGFDNLQIKLDPKPAASLKQGLTFTGANSPLVQTDTPITQIPNTVEMWIRLDPRIEEGQAKYRRPLISSVHPDGSGSTTVGDFALYAGLNGNLWWYEVTEDSVADAESQDTTYEQGRLSKLDHCDGEWMHVAVTRTQGKVILYINGEEIGQFESTVIGADATPTHPITFGYSSLASGTTRNNLDGAIGDVRLWSTTRTQAEICANMNKDLVGNEEGLMHYWTFDEQAGTVFNDSVANGINGTIVTQTYDFNHEPGLAFSGINKAVAVVDQPVDHIPQALEFWVKIDPNTAADQETLIAAYSGQTQAKAKSGDWYLGTTGAGALRWVEKNANGQSGQMNGTKKIRTGEWTHIAVVRYEGDIKFFINGVEDTISKASGVKYITLNKEKTASSTCPTLGYCVYNTGSYTNYLDGAIKDVRIWDTDRTQAQIAADMNKTLTGTEEGLLHYWKLDEASGTTFADATANGIGGTVTGDTTYWLKGVGLELPGINLPLATANEPVATLPKTVEMWVRLDSESKAKAHPLISAYNATTQAAGAGDWQLDVSGGVLRWVDMTSLGKSGQLKSTGKLPMDKYVHVAVTRENGSVKFYINGLLDSTVAYSMYEDITPSYTVPILGYSIFASSATSQVYLDGALKDIRVWNVTRTADEIAAGMNTTLTGNETGLMHYWKLDETEGTVFADSASAGHDGTPTVYWSTMISDPVEESYTNDGFNFYAGKKWESTKKLEQGIASVDAWVKVPKGTADDKRLTIISGWPYSNFTMDIYTKGRPRLYYTNADGVGTHYIAPVDVRTNEWTHIAWTLDSTTGIITCYVNGEAVYTNNNIGGYVKVTTMYVGRDDRSGWQYPFIGEVADVRVWSKTLSAEQVQYSMHTQLTQADGLILNLPLDEAADAKTLHDVSGNENHVEVWERVITWLDVEKQPSDYSFVILPDQQILTHYYPEKLNNMYQWVADHIEEENIQAVINVGDITDDNSILHWERAKTAYNIIDGKVPFIPVAGNHDYDTSKTYRDLTNMNQYFPVSLMENQGTQSGFYSRDMGLPDDSANHWQAFEVCGNKYIVVALEFGPRDSVLAWANDVIASHPDHQAIIVTHGYITHDGTWLDGTDAHVPSGYGFTKGEAEPANNADAVWEKLVSKQPNIIMVLSGHILKSDNVVSRVDVGDHGNEVIQFLIDGQNLDGIYGGFGLVAMMNFRDDGQTVEFTYYATDKGKYMNEENQFTFTLPAQEMEPAAQVAGQPYTTVTAALKAANGQIVQILKSTDEAITVTADATIDLAGHTLSNVTVSEGATLYGMDTTTDDYDCTDGYGKITSLTGNFALHHQTVVDGNPQRYLAVTEEDGISFHRFYLGIRCITLRPGAVGFGYKAIFGGDEKVQASLAKENAFGYNLWITEDKVVTCGTDVNDFVIGQTGTPLTLCLRDFDTKNHGESPVHATVYITLADGTSVTSAQYSYSMRSMVERINKDYASFSQSQLMAVARMIQEDATMQTWDVSNILSSLEQETP